MVDKSELKSISLFAELTEDELGRLAAMLKEKTFSRGEKIYGEGEPDGQFYIIRRGQVSISRTIREGQRQNLGNLGQGMYFGLISLIDGQPHSATARAKTDAELWMLKKADFDRLARENPACGIKILGVLVQSLCQYMRQINAKFMDMIQYVSLDR
jgi:CRP-like cAMP-binding protein